MVGTCTCISGVQVHHNLYNTIVTGLSIELSDRKKFSSSQGEVLDLI